MFSTKRPEIAPDALPRLGNFDERWPSEYRRIAEGAPPLLRAGRRSPDEELPDPDALADPTGEAGTTPLPYLLRKYPDRALLLVTGRCHFHCRFCFRRGAPPRHDLTDAELDAACEWFAEHPETREAILSGGDPLTLDDARLARILARLAEIPTLERLRLHTRAPVTVPERIGAAFLRAASGAGKPVRLVLHPIHPAEFRPALFMALGRLTRAGVGLGAQAVLLRGVNDDPATLQKLFRTLADEGVAPHYLHHPDRAAGNRGFRLSLSRGLSLYRAFQRAAAASGRPDAVPPYVIDLPNGAGKAPVGALRPVAERRESGTRRVRYRWDGGETRRVFEWWDIAEG